MNDNTVIISDKRIKLISITLLCLMPILGMAVDLIAPSLPSIANNLDASSSSAKNVITLYLLGYALGNFFSGILTDSLGRKILIRLGILGFVIASLLPVIFPNIAMMLFARLLQGITIGTVAVVARATFSDILPPKKLIKMGILIGSMFGIGPVVGPLIGGYLQFYFGWQSCFIFFAITMFLGFISVFFIVPETHTNLHPLNIKKVKSNLFEIISNQKFMGMIIIMGAVYSLMITFNTLGPFLIQTKLHYSPVFFGHLALYMGLAFLFATFICRYLLKHFSVEKLCLILINSFSIISILSLIISYFFNNNIILISIFSAIMFFACGFLFPMSMGKGISLFRHIAGTATAIMYLINILMTSLTAFLLSFIEIQNGFSLMLIYLSLMIICVISYWKFVHNKEDIHKIN